MRELFWGWTVCSDDTTPADWFADALAPIEGPLRVDAVVPASYPAHARVVHPAYTRADQRIRLRDIQHPHLQRWNGDPRFTQYVGGWPFGQPWDYRTPTIGNLDADDLAVVVGLLADHTGTTTCWALMWEGWGGLGKLGAPPRLVRASRTWERFALLRGEVATVHTLARDCGQAPSYLWPDDRAWVVGNDLDASSTYVAATANAVEDLIADERIEAYPASPTESCFPVPYPPDGA